MSLWLYTEKQLNGSRNNEYRKILQFIDLRSFLYVLVLQAALNGCGIIKVFFYIWDGLKEFVNNFNLFSVNIKFILCFKEKLNQSRKKIIWLPRSFERRLQKPNIFSKSIDWSLKPNIFLRIIKLYQRQKGNIPLKWWLISHTFWAANQLLKIMLFFQKEFKKSCSILGFQKNN